MYTRIFSNACISLDLAEVQRGRPTDPHCCNFRSGFLTPHLITSSGEAAPRGPDPGIRQRIQIGMIRPIRVDHTNCFYKWLLKLIHSHTHKYTHILCLWLSLVCVCVVWSRERGFPLSLDVFMCGWSSRNPGTPGISVEPVSHTMSERNEDRKIWNYSFTNALLTHSETIHI